MTPARKGRGPRSARRILDLETHDEIHVRMSQVIAYFAVGRRVVMKWIDNGLLPAKKVDDGGEWRFKVADLRTLDKQLEARGREAAKEAAQRYT